MYPRLGSRDAALGFADARLARVCWNRCRDGTSCKKKGGRAAIFPAGTVCAIFFVHAPRNTGVSCFAWRPAGLFGFPALAVAL